MRVHSLMRIWSSLSRRRSRFAPWLCSTDIGFSMKTRKCDVCLMLFILQLRITTPSNHQALLRSPSALGKQPCWNAAESSIPNNVKMYKRLIQCRPNRELGTTLMIGQNYAMLKRGWSKSVCSLPWSEKAADVKLYSDRGIETNASIFVILTRVKRPFVIHQSSRLKSTFLLRINTKCALESRTLMCPK